MALGLGVPFAVVLSKTDLLEKGGGGSQDGTETALRQVERWLTGPGIYRVPMRVRNEDEAITAAANFFTDR